VIREPKRRRGFQWYLLIGFLAGIGLGIWIAWFVSPVSYTDVAPSGLSSTAKDHYRILAAQAYNAQNNLERGKARLALLDEGDPARALAGQAQRMVAGGGRIDDARALALMAAAFSSGQANTGSILDQSTPVPSATAAAGAESTVTPVVTQPEATETPIETQVPTFSLTPTETPPPFAVQAWKNVCDKAYPTSQIMIDVKDAKGQPVPGVEIIVTWQNGEDHFITGMKPDVDAGYADFAMEPNVVYTLRVANSQQPLTDLKAASCSTDSGKTFWGSVQVTYNQP
jgi:hypothetical protein